MPIHLETKMADTSQNKAVEKDGQLLHLVFGGELEQLQGVTFKDLDKVEIVGLFPELQDSA